MQNDTAFQEWFRSLFTDVIKPRYIPILTNRVDLIERAFTSKQYDAQYNYEDLEILGDGAAACFLPLYFYRRFPQLNNAAGVKIIARLKIKYASRQTFASLARSLGFWPWIRKPPETTIHMGLEDSLLEDVFEAVLGVICLALDDHFKSPGVGAAIVYTFLENLFDRMDIKLDHEQLFDAKTRLKELIDVQGNILGNLRYVTEGTRNTTKLYVGEELIAQADGPVKKDREQQAAEQALTVLNNRGFRRKR